VTLETVWTDFKTKLIAQNIEGALNNVATSHVQQFREQLLLLGNANIQEMMNAAGPVTPVFIEENLAKYNHARAFEGSQVTFALCFVKENGRS